jgi:hypothetical protein
VPIDKLKKMLKVDVNAAVKNTPESNTNNNNGLTIGRRDVKSNSVGCAEEVGATRDIPSSGNILSIHYLY